MVSNEDDNIQTKQNHEYFFPLLLLTFMTQVSLLSPPNFSEVLSQRIFDRHLKNKLG